MNGVISKIARLAASKAAAFSYAVAVGVAGNLAFNFVQQHHAPPLAPSPALSAADSRAAPVGTATLPLSVPPRAAAPVLAQPSARPTTSAAKPAAVVPILPEPPPVAAVALPTPDKLPAPALKPAALPTPPSNEASAEVLPKKRPAATTVGAPLPPLGPAVDVAPPPAPATATATAPLPGEELSGKEAAAVRPASAAPPASVDDRSWRFSDIWHPGEAVSKGLHWAGDQLPVIGGDHATPPFPAPAPPLPAPSQPSRSAAPIPLVPPTAWAASAEKADSPLPPPRRPSAPGPGSGGLY